MKKRILMVLSIIAIILLIPRYNGDSHITKKNHGQRFPFKKTHEDPDDFDLPLPSIWSVMNILPKTNNKRRIALPAQFFSLVKQGSTYNIPVCGYI